MSDFVDATFYVQIKPEYAGGISRDNPNSIRRAKATALTQAKPGRPQGGTVTTKLTVRIPKSAFLPLAPEAIVVVPADMVHGEPIEVEAGDATA